jgi:hypothetical protein
LLIVAIVLAHAAIALTFKVVFFSCVAHQTRFPAPKLFVSRAVAHTSPLLNLG